MPRTENLRLRHNGTVTWVAGADGCRAGWFIVLRHLRSGRMISRCVTSFADVLKFPEQPEIITVDIPIGLLECAEEGGRECDRQARRLLGAPRASSVFSPPVRPALVATTYKQACRINARSSPNAMQIAKQCFGLFSKLREVDALMTPRRQKIVFEVHPELCFYELNCGVPMRHRKRIRDGKEERLEVLIGSRFIEKRPDVAAGRRHGLAMDDVLDAYVACWTAGRIARGQARRIPKKPALDTKRLRMEIWR